MTTVDATSMDSATLLAEAAGFVGGPAGEIRVGRDPVNQPMVNQWCQALGDTNPAYLDPEWAASSRRGHLIAPPGMLQTWVMDAPRDVAPGSTDHVLTRLDAAGYTSVVAVNYEHEYLRELLHGERLNVRSIAEDLSAEKTTALGKGVFTTIRSEYTTDDGELVGIGRMRLLKFKPPAPAPAIGVRAAIPIGRDNAYFWDGVEAGELRLQHCPGCDVLRHPPQPLCDRCGNADQGFVVSAGHGTIYSHVQHHYPPLPGVQLPHTALLVDLDEGLRLVSELAPGEDDAAVVIGARVRVCFEQVPGAPRTLPVFRLEPTA